MKLHTSIPPRRDGTVKVTGQDSQTYVFEVDADGELSCDVTDEATLAAMLSTDNFYPADPADAEAAADLMVGQDEEADDEPEEADESEEGALPVEAETPPSPKRARKVK